jgi:arsenate reductase (glutaredoxin)
MSDLTIYHNPRCSKSRQTLELIRGKGVEPEIVLYLEDVPAAEDIQDAWRCLHQI